MEFVSLLAEPGSQWLISVGEENIRDGLFRREGMLKASPVLVFPPHTASPDVCGIKATSAALLIALYIHFSIPPPVDINSVSKITNYCPCYHGVCLRGKRQHSRLELTSTACLLWGIEWLQLSYVKNPFTQSQNPITSPGRPYEGSPFHSAQIRRYC